MNKTMETQVNHVSVRSFTEQVLSEEQIKELVTVAQSASSSNFQQAYSIIDIQEQTLREQIAELAGNQPFLAKGGNLFIFCADVHRQSQLSKEQEIDIQKILGGMETTLLATIDASVAAQNMVVAAESMGLGACYIGGVRDGIVEISELLDLPEYVYPAFGLIIGYPQGEKNALKPRLPFEAVYHQNKYSQDKKELIDQYEETTKAYYEERSGKKENRTWGNSTVGSFVRKPRKFMKEFLNSKGFAKR
ncbi:MAG: oxygen-insensitive NADPH nitroreductase [Enterococcus sp.]